MNQLDQLLQKHFPTVMVPKYEALEECPVGQTRLLLASDGLYIQTRQEWGELITQLWEAPRRLPYGVVEPRDTFNKILMEFVDNGLLEQAVAEAARYAEENKEWAGWIVWSRGKGLEYREIPFTSTPTRADMELPDLEEGTRLAIDIHSHGQFPPSFSPTDDIDDRGGVKISVVLGGYDKNSALLFRTAARYAVEGFSVDLGMEGEV